MPARSLIVNKSCIYIGYANPIPAWVVYKGGMIRSILLGLFAILLSSSPARSWDDRAEFGKDILPLLKNHCLACHTLNQAKAELRLDTVELMLKGGESGPALVKGDSAKSLLYQVVSGKHETSMPPKKNKVGAMPLKVEEDRKSVV